MGQFSVEFHTCISLLNTDEALYSLVMLLWLLNDAGFILQDWDVGSCSPPSWKREAACLPWRERMSRGNQRSCHNVLFARPVKVFVGCKALVLFWWLTVMPNLPESMPHRGEKSEGRRAQTSQLCGGGACASTVTVCESLLGPHNKSGPYKVKGPLGSRTSPPPQEKRPRPRWPRKGVTAESW